MTDANFLTPEILEGVELTKAQILRPDQVLYFRSLFTQLTLALAEIDASATKEEREANEIRRAHDCGKRALLLELLQDSENATSELQQLTANS